MNKMRTSEAFVSAPCLELTPLWSERSWLFEMCFSIHESVQVLVPQDLQTTSSKKQNLQWKTLEQEPDRSENPPAGFAQSPEYLLPLNVAATWSCIWSTTADSSSWYYRRGLPMIPSKILTHAFNETSTHFTPEQQPLQGNHHIGLCGSDITG